MTDWNRKLTDTLACATKLRSEDDSLSMAHREQLATLYRQAKRLTTDLRDCTTSASAEITVALCDICKDIGNYQCAGRDGWAA